MKKTYRLPLLVLGLVIILTQISAFTLQTYFNRSHLTIHHTIDLIFMLAIGFALILQFKGFTRFVMIDSVVYTGFGILYAATAGSDIELVVSSLTMEVIFVLSMLLAYTLLTISVLFIMVNEYQTKFPIKFTKLLVGVSLIISALLILVGLFMVTAPTLESTLVAVSSYLALLAFFGMLFLLIEEKVPEEKQIPNSALQELERLYARGIITQEEYQTRKEKLESK